MQQTPPASIGSDSPFASGRTFQVWRYVVGHSQLLLRSTKEHEGHTSRVEVLFKGVRRLDLPTVMVGLTVASAGDDVFRLSGADWEGSVEAVGAWWVEDDDEYLDASTLFVDQGWQAEQPS